MKNSHLKIACKGSINNCFTKLNFKIMYSVWKNAKRIALFKTYKGALKKFNTLCQKSDKEKDLVELFKNDYLINFQ